MGGVGLQVEPSKKKKKSMHELGGSVFYLCYPQKSNATDHVKAISSCTSGFASYTPFFSVT